MSGKMPNQIKSKQSKTNEKQLRKNTRVQTCKPVGI